MGRYAAHSRKGLGAALLEEFRYAPDGGFQSGTLADYLMPTACEVPDPDIVHMETPSPFTPLGAKGLGEGNNMSTPVCIANAFADALRPLRARIRGRQRHPPAPDTIPGAGPGRCRRTAAAGRACNIDGRPPGAQSARRPCP
jgi:CO/xanthine dehydrogenase Mo-binding subunit